MPPVTHESALFQDRSTINKIISLGEKLASGGFPTPFKTLQASV